MGSLPLLIVETRNCLHCGFSFDLTQKQVRKNKIYCSKKCAAQVNGGKKVKNNFNCLNCGLEFRSPPKPDGRRKKYCSPECKSEHKRTLLVCEFCKIKFRAYGRDKEKKYCSWSCRKQANPIPVVDLSCSTCHEKFQRETSQAYRSDADPFRRAFCSPKCYSEGTSGKNSVLYLGNRSADRGPSWAKQRKKALKDADGKCYFCDKPVKGKQACVDHIIPFRLFKNIPDEGLSANNLSNLWVLCRSCPTKKTQLERGVLYSAGFKEFMSRVAKITTHGVEDRMNRAHDWWASSLAFNEEMVA